MNRLGGTRVIAIYAETLARRGHEVCVVSTPRRAVSLRGKVKRLLSGAGWPRGEEAGPSYLDGLPIEHRVLERWRGVRDEDVPDADVVVATWWETAEPVLRLAPRKGAKAYFVQDYGAHAGQPLDKVSRTWQYPMHKITISRWLEGLIREHVGTEAEIACVPNAVDTGLFHAPPRGKQAVPTFGLVYSTRPQKGSAAALRALERARRRIPSLRAVAFGHGAPADELPLIEGMDYFPNLEESRLREVYARCDAWLFTSEKEGFGLPILEAMACRTPVIATPAGAAPELVGEGGGVLVAAGDVEALAEAVVRVARMDEAEWRRMSDAAHRTATAYEWDQAAARFEAELLRARQEAGAAAVGR